MTCYRILDNWHSYVKSSLSEAELHEMTSHLTNCPECRDLVYIIQKTAGSLAKSRLDFLPPAAIKINVMMAIDKNRYVKHLSSTKLSHIFQLRNWGFSMIAAGILLFALNLTSLTPDPEGRPMSELHIKLSQQMAIPFHKMSQVANDTLGKIESLTSSKHK